MGTTSTPTRLSSVASFRNVSCTGEYSEVPSVASFRNVSCTGDYSEVFRGDCNASAFVSARLGLPRPEDTSIVRSTIPITSQREHDIVSNPLPLPLPQLEGSSLSQDHLRNCLPIIEEPASPEHECVGTSESDIEDIEDAFYNDLDEIPTIKLNLKEFTENLENFIEEMNTGLRDDDMSKALVSITPETASIPMPKLKNVSRMCTMHQVYVLKDDSYLLKGLDKRDPDDPCPYLLAIWSPGETAQSTEPPKVCCNSQDGNLCDNKTCFSCNGMREAQARTVRGTILIPCRTANKGSFPLNGTYFQVNEVFADHYTSHIPLHVPRDELWPLERRTVYFGTSVSAMLKGVTMKDVQDCFWKGYVCVRAFNRETRKPKPLFERLHLSAIQATKIKAQERQKTKRDNTTHDEAKKRT